MFEVYEIFSLKWMTQTVGEMEPFKKTYICIAMDLHHKISKKCQSQIIYNVRTCNMYRNGEKRQLWNSGLQDERLEISIVWLFQVCLHLNTEDNKKMNFRIGDIMDISVKGNLIIQLFLDQPD